MSYTVANTALTNSFDYMRTRLNELAFAMSTVAVTTNSNTAAGNAAISGTFTANSYVAGNSTVNVAISGTTGGISGNSFSFTTGTANTLTVGNSTVNSTANSTYLRVGTTISVGNSTTNTVVTAAVVTLANSTSNVAVSVPSAAAKTAGNFYLNANGSWVAIEGASVPISVGAASTSGTSQQVIDSYLKSSQAACEYTLHVKNNVANQYSTCKILTVHDTNNSLSTEWATMNSNGSIGTFNSFTNATHVILSFTPVPSSCAVKFAKVLL